MLASFAIIPIGNDEELKEHIAVIMKLVTNSGLSYKLGAMQTTVEGDREKVMALIMDCHNKMRERASRVLTHITIDDREGATNRLTGKVNDVEDILKPLLKH